jgi:hypothetical protein
MLEVRLQLIQAHLEPCYTARQIVDALIDAAELSANPFFKSSMRRSKW